VVLPVVGCAEVTGSDVVELTISAREFVEQTPLEGVEICVTDAAGCVTTDMGGTATVELPANEKISWTTTKEGYLSILYGDVTDGAFESNHSINMVTNQWMTAYLSSLPTPYPLRGTGMITMILAPRIPGVTLALLDATGRRYYEDDEKNPSYGLDATTSAGNGGFVEVGPGAFQVELGGMANGCVPIRAWPGDAKNRIQVPVREGFSTRATVRCPVP